MVDAGDDHIARAFQLGTGVIAGIDHRETSYSAPAFEATYRFITGRAPATTAVVPEAAITLSGMVTGSGVDPLEAKSGNFANNLPLPGARLEVYAVQPDGPDAGALEVSAAGAPVSVAMAVDAAGVLRFMAERLAQ